MYKTIRQGENSLQYTILPQNDDFRIESKLTCSSSSKLKSKRSARRRSVFAYLGLLFVCTVIIGAVLVPFLVSAENLPNPSNWFLKTKATITSSVKRIGATSSPPILTILSPNTSATDVRNNNEAMESTIHPYILQSTQISDTQRDTRVTLDAASTVIIGTSSKNEARTTKIKDLQVKNDVIAEMRFQGQISAAVAPTTIVTNVRDNVPNKASFIEAGTPSTLTTTTILTIKPSPGLGDPNINGRAMQVSLIKSKKPIIPPVLAKTNSLGKENVRTFIRYEPNENQKMIQEASKEPNYSLRSHWPYIDPSTYFQWTGYQAEDSVILPAILGVALIVVVLIVALFCVARSKRAVVSSARKRNRNDIEEAGEDNTTLLTNSNLSDDD